jgi:hypothetical protein
MVRRRRRTQSPDALAVVNGYTIYYRRENGATVVDAIYRLK